MKRRHGWDEVRFCAWWRCSKRLEPTDAANNLRTATKQRYCNATHKKLAQRERRRRSVAAAVFLFIVAVIGGCEREPARPTSDDWRRLAIARANRAVAAATATAAAEEVTTAPPTTTATPRRVAVTPAAARRIAAAAPPVAFAGSTPAPVVQVNPGAAFAITNQMRVATPVWYAEQNRYTLPTVVRAVRFAVTQSAEPPLAFAESLPGAFLPIGGQANIQAPLAAGQYYIHLRYEFDGENGVGQQAIVSKPFVVLAFPATPTPCVDTPLGRPGPFGACYNCAGQPIPGVENRNGVCVRATTATPTPRDTATPRPTVPYVSPTPCVNVPGGIPGPFGGCYDCAGVWVGAQPCGVATPVPTTAVPTSTPSMPPTPRPTTPAPQPTSTPVVVYVVVTATCPPCAATATATPTPLASSVTPTPRPTDTPVATRTPTPTPAPFEWPCGYFGRICTPTPTPGAPPVTPTPAICRHPFGFCYDCATGRSVPCP